MFSLLARMGIAGKKSGAHIYGCIRAGNFSFFFLKSILIIRECRNVSVHKRFRPS